MAKKKKAMVETVAPLAFTREGDDLVIRVTGLYATIGVSTSSDKDTRKVAASPGMFTWVPDDSPVSHPNPENRRLGLKVTAILGKPRDVSGRDASKASDVTKPMSSATFG